MSEVKVTIGAYLDTMGLKFPEAMEPGDVLTDALLIYMTTNGEGGRDVWAAVTDGTHQITAEGLLRVADKTNVVDRIYHPEVEDTEEAE